MSKPILRRSCDLPTVHTRDGAEVVELFGTHCTGIQNISIAVGQVASHLTASPHHHHKSDEVYYILSGYGIVRVGEQEYPVGPGDAIFIPRHYLHSLENTDKKPLRVLCIASPPFDASDFVLKSPE